MAPPGGCTAAGRAPRQAGPTRHKGDVPRLLVRRHQLRKLRHAGGRQVGRQHPRPALPRRPLCRHPAAAVPDGPHKQASGAAVVIRRQRHYGGGLRLCQVTPSSRGLDACTDRAAGVRWQHGVGASSHACGKLPLVHGDGGVGEPSPQANLPPAARPASPTAPAVPSPCCGCWPGRPRRCRRM